MLRFASSSRRTLKGFQIRDRALVGKRNLTSTGTPSPKHQNPITKKSETPRPSSIRRPQNNVRRPEFLQSLRVQTKPNSEEAVGTSFRPQPNPPRPSNQRTGGSSNKMASLLRSGPGAQGASNRHSATQSRLQGNNNADPGDTNLVDFFRKKLVEHKDKAGSANNPNRGNSNRARILSQQQQRTNNPPGSSSFTRSPGLNAARGQLRYAEEAKPGSTVLDVLDNAKANGTEAPGATINAPKTASEGFSPIRQYVAELQKRNREMKKQNSSQTPSDAKEPEIPSWRKTAYQQHDPAYQQQQDPRFSSPSDTRHGGNLQQTQSQRNELKPNSLRERVKNMARDDGEKKFKPPPVSAMPEVVLPSDDVTIRELSQLFKVKATKIMKALQDLGEKPRGSADFVIDADLVEMVALEMDIKFKKQKVKAKVDNDYEKLMERRRRNENVEANTDVAATSYDSLPPRAPVVCIMGHVDHGKTTLMDALRRRSKGGDGKQDKKKKAKNKKAGTKASSEKGDVAGTEAGGITQAVSAFQVPLGGQDDAITFLDTPGHAAFSAMRQSGSTAADIIVLVIAADDGIQPQTVEILNLYKSLAKDSKGGITMVVSMNKIDKPGIDVEESKRRIENQLLEHDIIPEGMATDGDGEYGSPVQFFPISAKSGQGLDDLIEGLALQSEVMDLRSDDTARAEGIVMDARVEQGLGVVVDAIVRWGSIQKGDIVVSDTCIGKVRLLKDVNDKALKKGMPSQPVRIVGFKSCPKAGDPIVCVASEQEGNELIEKRLARKNQGKVDGVDASSSSFSQVILTGTESRTSAGTERRLERYGDLSLDQVGPIRIPVIVKASADGSVSAVRDALQNLSAETSFDINIDTIAEGVGPLSATEIEMAKESNAAVFCFDVKNQDKAVRAMAETEGVKIHEFDIIYSLLEEAKEVFTKYMPSVQKITVHGKAKVREVFEINGGKDNIAGLRVLEGALHKSYIESDKATPAYFRVIRNGVELTPNTKGVQASTLKIFKEAVEKVKNGEECGLGFTDVVDFREGDTIECFSVKMIQSFVGTKGSASQ